MGVFTVLNRGSARVNGIQQFASQALFHGVFVAAARCGDQPTDGQSLAALWALKLNPATALIFPSVIGVLMVLRAKVLPKIFTTQELRLLDTRIGATKA